MMSNRFAQLSVALMALSMMVACGEDTPECATNADCAANERCNSDGACVPTGGTGGTAGSGGSGGSGGTVYGKVAQALVPDVSLRPDPKGDSLGTALPLANDLRAYGSGAESFSSVDMMGLDLAYGCDTQDESLLVLCGGRTPSSGTLQIAQSQFWARVPLTEADSCSSYSVAFGERQYDMHWDAPGQSWQLAVTSTVSNAPASMPSAARAVLEGDTLTWLIPSSEVDTKATVEHSSSVDDCGNAAPLGRDVIAMHRPVSDGIPSNI